MPAIKWDTIGSKVYEAGVDRGVFYPEIGLGIAWPGLVSVDEKTTGGEILPLYSEGIRVRNVITSTNFQADITAFSAPPEFLPCDGVAEFQNGLFVTQQPRVRFAFSYRTMIYNDLGLIGYKIHIVYNAVAQPFAHAYKSLSRDVDMPELKWTIDTVPEVIVARRPTAHIIIDTTRHESWRIENIEQYLYGTTNGVPRIMTPAEIAAELDEGFIP